MSWGWLSYPFNRLEEFAAAVNDRLNTIDFNTKRAIIRALVKRIEIHKDEIWVVFRLDPDPGINTGENSTDSHMRSSSMQDRTRRHYKRPRLLKAGDPSIRATLSMAAVVAIQHNPDIRCRYERLLERGKKKMVALGAAMRKLVHIAFGVLKHQQKYHPLGT